MDLEGFERGLGVDLEGLEGLEVGLEVELGFDSRSSGSRSCA